MHTRYPGTLLLLLWSCGILAFSSPAPSAEKDLQLLWQVGEFDDNNSEFYLSPNHFSQYDRPGIHVVGLSKPAESWPYILPGNLDTWAGDGSQTFEIYFYLEKVGSSGSCRLLLDFLDTHSFAPPVLRVEINTQAYEIRTEQGNNDWLMAAENGSGQEYRAPVLFPVSLLKKGENRIGITASKGSWALWDAISLETPSEVESARAKHQSTIRSVRQKQLLVDRDGQLYKALELELLHTGSATQASVQINGVERLSFEMKPGSQILEVWIPETGREEEVEIELSSEGDVRVRTTATSRPVRKWELHLIHQTHLDIGFTHTQEEVLEKQTSYLHEALDLIEKTKDYPEEARFRWHPEGMWAIDEFLRRVGPAKREQFIQAVHDQSIHLDAFYVHLLSGLATGEELIELMQPAKDFEKEHGVAVRTAIGSDIPGYSWGLVTAMAEQGVEFFNMAPNNNHRLGHLYHWADTPFYWQGPDGFSRVLTWMASHAYIYFWVQNEGMRRVPRFLDYLERSDFPYEIAMLRYEIGGDNGFPDPSLPEKVKKWNETYAWPRLMISTNSLLYDSFTDRYESEIPVISGDLTPYWEDGATSTSADLALNRRAGEQLIQAQALQAMVSSTGAEEGWAPKAWNNVIMYDEHTWGAYCSISDPEDPFTVSQEEYKQRFAIRADSLTCKAMEDVLKERTLEKSGYIDVFNTSSWKRSEMVLLTADQSLAGDRVLDDREKPVVSQRLASGELAFRAEEIPAFGARRFRITAGECFGSSGVSVSEQKISNEFLEVRIDPGSGAIESLIMKSNEVELVDTSLHLLNDYMYMLGRESGKNSSGIDSPVVLTIEDAGPLVGSLRIESGAPGCRKLTRKVRLISGESRVDLTNTLDKMKVLEPEGVYFTFPLNIPEGISRMDIPWGVVRPETDQLKGANRNYYPVQRWMDISNGEYGITWMTEDAPMIAFHPLKIVGKGRGDSWFMSEFGKKGIRDWWTKNIRTDQGFYSWVMSNHWEVNYKAFQEGEVAFRYSLFPHDGGYKGTEAEKRGRNLLQPLMAVEVDGKTPLISPLFSISDGKLIATSLKAMDKGNRYMLRLYNPESSTESIGISPVGDGSLDILYCDPSGNPSGRAGNQVELPGYGLATLLISQEADQKP